MTRWGRGIMMLLAVGALPVRPAPVRTLPAALYQQMRPNRRIGQLWVDPAFNGAEGLKVGPVTSSVVHDQAPDLLKYAPFALARLVRPEATNTLALTITEMQVRQQNADYRILLGVEGLVTSPDGKPLVAFTSQESYNEAHSPEEEFHSALRALVFDLHKELNLPLAKVEKAPKVKINGSLMETLLVDKSQAPATGTPSPAPSAAAGTPEQEAPAVSAPEAGSTQPAPGPGPAKPETPQTKAPAQAKAPAAQPSDKKPKKSWWNFSEGEEDEGLDPNVVLPKDVGKRIGH